MTVGEILKTCEYDAEEHSCQQMHRCGTPSLLIILTGRSIMLFDPTDSMNSRQFTK